MVAGGYMTELVILALTSFFSVPKGIDYIHMLFGATVSVLNDYLWAPNVMLLAMGTFLMVVVPDN